jgi:GntR family transcriptional regulator
MSRIRADIATPLYIQLKDIIVKRINSEYYHEGQKLPSERELCDYYNVSRITVRQALNELERAGLIKKYQGKGTYVSKTKLEQELLTITPFRETLLAKGITPETRYMGYKEIDNTYQLSTTLRIPIHDKIAKIEILGLGDNVPISFYTSYLSVQAGQMMDRMINHLIERNQPCTTIDAYKEFTDISIGSIYQTFEASLADKTSSRMLDIKIGSPVLKIKSIVCSKNEEPIESRVAIYRGDMYKFTTIRNCR